ncbi:MAG: acetylxylan esterase [Planctomycetota bacterium]
MYRIPRLPTLVVSLFVSAGLTQAQCFQRGNTNCDPVFDISDPVSTLGWLFVGGAEPCCIDAADSNDDGEVNITDAVVSLSFLFLGAAPPAPPFRECGEDPTPDNLSCLSYSACDRSCSLAYVPESEYARGTRQIVDLSYEDIAGLDRTFSIEIRVPADAPRPIPVVVWSHGGSGGRVNPSTVGQEWGDTFVRAGYLTIAIAHPARREEGEPNERVALCEALGFTPEGCSEFRHLFWDRNQDFKRVLDWLQEENDPRVDLDRIAYAGHSAGGGAALAAAGARREFAGVLRDVSDDRPIAFLSCSPQGPGDDSWTEDSFDFVDRPHMSITGAGDDTGGTVAENRRGAYMNMPEGDKYIAWIEDEAARHGTFQFKTDACLRHGAEEARCDEHLKWVRSAGLAFLDAYVRRDPVAIDYLGSDKLERLSAGLVDYRRK